MTRKTRPPRFTRLAAAAVAGAAMFAACAASAAPLLDEAKHFCIEPRGDVAAAMKLADAEGWSLLPEGSGLPEGFSSGEARYIMQGQGIHFLVAGEGTLGDTIPALMCFVGLKGDAGTIDVSGYLGFPPSEGGGGVIDIWLFKEVNGRFVRLPNAEDAALEALDLKDPTYFISKGTEGDLTIITFGVFTGKPK